MPAAVLVVVVPEIPPSVIADEFHPRIFANRSSFPVGAVLVADQDITASVFANVSTFGAHRLEENTLADVNLTGSVFSNTSTFGAHTLAEAPPDGTLRPTVFSNTSTFGAPTILEAPADGLLRPTVFANVSTFGASSIDGGATVYSGDGASAGTGTAAATAAVLVAGAGAAAGTSTAAAIAAAVMPAAGASAGTSTAAAVSAETWDPAFAPAKFTLSNVNKTATATDHNQVDTIIGKLSRVIGRPYFEITAGGGGADLRWGISTAGQTNSSLGSATGIQLSAAGNWRISGADTASGAGAVTSATLGFAIDLAAKLIWFRRTATPGTWWGNNGPGDPAAGTNGMSFATAAGAGSPMFISFTSNQNGNDQAATMNAGSSSFVAAPPNDFTGWQFDPPIGAFSFGTSTAVAVGASSVAAAGASAGTSTTAAVGDSFVPAEWASSSYFALTGSNLIATRNTATANRSIVSTTSKSSGKRYFELVATAFENNGWLGGLANASATLSSYLGSDANSFGAGFNSSGGALGFFIISATFTNNQWTTTLPVSGDVFGYAVDWALGKIWVNKNNGAWNQGAGGTQNPATGQGGFSISSLLASGPVFIGMTGLNSAVADAATLHARTSNQAYAAPSGFTAWDG